MDFLPLCHDNPCTIYTSLHHPKLLMRQVDMFHFTVKAALLFYSLDEHILSKSVQSRNALETAGMSALRQLKRITKIDPKQENKMLQKFVQLAGLELSMLLRMAIYLQGLTANALSRA